MEPEGEVGSSVPLRRVPIDAVLLVHSPFRSEAEGGEQVGPGIPRGPPLHGYGEDHGDGPMLQGLVPPRGRPVEEEQPAAFRRLGAAHHSGAGQVRPVGEDPVRFSRGAPSAREEHVPRLPRAPDIERYPRPVAQVGPAPLGIPGEGGLFALEVEAAHRAGPHGPGERMGHVGLAVAPEDEVDLRRLQIGPDLRGRGNGQEAQGEEERRDRAGPVRGLHSVSSRAADRSAAVVPSTMPPAARSSRRSISSAAAERARPVRSARTFPAS